MSENHALKMAETSEQRAERLQLIPMEPLNPPPKVVRKPPYVVHLKRQGGVESVSCDVYIGRAMHHGGWNLDKSIWANPFTLAKHAGDRKKVIAAYEAYILANPLLLAALPELEGKRLGCWCFPEECHGDVLVKLFNERVASA